MKKGCQVKWELMLVSVLDTLAVVHTSAVFGGYKAAVLYHISLTEFWLTSYLSNALYF